MHEQLSLLTLDFRLNLPRMSERLAKPLPALPVPDLNRQAANLQAEDTGSSSYSPKAANRQRQPYFSHINGQEFRGNSGALAELPIAKEGTVVADKPTLPLCPTTSPERSLIVSLLPLPFLHQFFLRLKFGSFPQHLQGWTNMRADPRIRATRPQTIVTLLRYARQIDHTLKRAERPRRLWLGNGAPLDCSRRRKLHSSPHMRQGLMLL